MKNLDEIWIKSGWNLDKIWIKGHGQHFCNLQFDEIFLLYITLFYKWEAPSKKTRVYKFISFRPPNVGKYVAILFFILRGSCSHTFFIFHSCMHELLAYQLHSCLAIHFRFSLFKYCDMIFLRGNPNINRNFDLEQILLSVFPPFALRSFKYFILPILNFKIL